MGYQFLTDLFHKYDKDGDQALSPPEQDVCTVGVVGLCSVLLCCVVQELFSLCLLEPWDEQLIAVTVETNGEGWITLPGFLAFWTYACKLSILVVNCHFEFNLCVDCKLTLTTP